MHEINRPNMNRINFCLGLTGRATKRDVKKMYEYIIQLEESTKEYQKIMDKLYTSAEKVLKMIPECPVHGEMCLPHYSEWIEERKLINIALKNGEILALRKELNAKYNLIENLQKELKTHKAYVKYVETFIEGQVGVDLPIAGVGNPALAAFPSNRVAFIDEDEFNDDLRIYEFDGENWVVEQLNEQQKEKKANVKNEKCKCK